MRGKDGGFKEHARTHNLFRGDACGRLQTAPISASSCRISLLLQFEILNLYFSLCSQSSVYTSLHALAHYSENIICMDESRGGINEAWRGKYFGRKISQLLFLLIFVRKESDWCPCILKKSRSFWA